MYPYLTLVYVHVLRSNCKIPFDRYQCMLICLRLFYNVTLCCSVSYRFTCECMFEFHSMALHFYRSCPSRNYSSAIQGNYTFDQRIVLQVVLYYCLNNNLMLSIIHIKHQSYSPNLQRPHIWKTQRLIH